MDVKSIRSFYIFWMPAHRNRCFRTGRWSWMLTFMNIFPVCIEKAFASDDSKNLPLSAGFPRFCRRCSTMMTLLTFRAVLRV